MTGGHELKRLEEIGATFMAWKDDVRPSLAEWMKGLREEMDKTPTSQESLVGAYAIMATEIVVRKERAGDSIDGKVADQLSHFGSRGRLRA